MVGVAAASAAVGTVIGVVKTIDGVELGKVCKQMMREQRNAISKLDDKKLRESARDGFKKKVSGRFPKYKNHSITVQSNGQLKLVSGDKC